MNRIDALEHHHKRRFGVLVGQVLAQEPDAELQAIVTEGAAALEVPITLVTLVLERTQYFRAHHGLSNDLALARATDRDVSFCQLVVRDSAPLLVSEASTDARVPQELVQRYGIESYLGVPVTISGEVVGTLCGVDTQPRVFSDAQVELWRALAKRVSARLQQLADMRPPAPSLFERAGTPVLAELRNLMVPLLNDLASASIAITDLAPLGRLGLTGSATGNDQKVLGALLRATDAINDLRELIDGLHGVADSLVHSVEALGKIVAGAPSLSIDKLLATAERICHNDTKRIGGVRWLTDAPNRAVLTPTALAVSMLAATLSEVAIQRLNENWTAGIEAMLQTDGDVIRVVIAAPNLERAWLGQLRQLSIPHIAIETTATSVALAYDLAPPS